MWGNLCLMFWKWLALRSLLSPALNSLILHWVTLVCIGFSWYGGSRVAVSGSNERNIILPYHCYLVSFLVWFTSSKSRPFFKLKMSACNYKVFIFLVSGPAKGRVEGNFFPVSALRIFLAYKLYEKQYDGWSVGHPATHIFQKIHSHYEGHASAPLLRIFNPVLTNSDK